MIRTVIYIAMLSCLTGCQGIKLGSTGKAISTENSTTASVELSQQLLVALSSQTQYKFSLNDEQLAQQALENNFTNQSAKWQLVEGNIELIPITTFEKEKGEFCRDYQTKLITDITETAVKSTACRKTNGLWIRIQ